MHLHKNVYVNIYSSIIHNNQNLKSNENIPQPRNELKKILIFFFKQWSHIWHKRE